MAFALSGHVLTTIPDVSFQPLTHHRIQSMINPMRLTEIPTINQLQDMADYAELTWGVSAARWLAYVQERSGETLTIPVEVQLFELNEGSFSGIPMEPFCETALQIKRMRQTELAFSEAIRTVTSVICRQRKNIRIVGTRWQSIPSSTVQ